MSEVWVSESATTDSTSSLTYFWRIKKVSSVDDFKTAFSCDKDIILTQYLYTAPTYQREVELPDEDVEYSEESY